MFDSSWQGWGLMQSGISAFAGLGGVLVGSWMTTRNQRAERVNAHIVRQLQEFYSPMLGMWSDIRAKIAVGNEIKQLSVEVYERAKKEGREDERQAALKRRATLGMYKYDSAQWSAHIFPLYEKMLIHFTDHMWLAESSTIDHYEALVRYIENWKRIEDFELESEIVVHMETSEDQIEPLRVDLQRQFERLREILQR